MTMGLTLSALFAFGLASGFAAGQRSLRPQLHDAIRKSMQLNEARYRAVSRLSATLAHFDCVTYRDAANVQFQVGHQLYDAARDDLDFATQPFRIPTL